MDKDYIVKTKVDGKEYFVSIIGFFKVPGFSKEYAMYSLVDDDSNNEYGSVLLGEVLRDNEKIEIVGIEEEEQDLVVAFYNEISKQVGEE